MKLAALSLLCCVVPTQQAPLANLDFQAGTQVHWQGTGFPVRPGTQKPRWVGSAAAHNPGGKATLRYVFTVPPNTGRIHFSAHAVYANGAAADKRMNVFLLGANHRQVQKFRRTEDGWTPTSALLPAANGVS